MQRFDDTTALFATFAALASHGVSVDLSVVQFDPITGVPFGPSSTARGTAPILPQPHEFVRMN